MTESDRAEVLSAFEILLEEIEAAIELASQSGTKAFQRRDFDAARAAAQRADKMTGFRERLLGMREEWQGLTAGDETHAVRRNLGCLQRGLRTPEEAFRKPILQALVDVGGRGALEQVLQHVEKAMQGILKDVDHEPLASDPDMPRWWNSAQWARWNNDRGANATAPFAPPLMILRRPYERALTQ